MLVATAQAIKLGWTPVGDDGFIAIRAFDVFGSHSPLLGQYTQTSPLAGAATYSLGPLSYWAFSVPAHLGPAALVLTAGAISAASVVGSVLLARWLGGIGLMLGTAAVLVLMTRSLPSELPYEIWNCWAGFFPFVVAVFLAWAVACGHHRLLPLLVLATSYAAQCSLTYVLPLAGASAVAMVGLGLHLRHCGGSGRWRQSLALAVAVFVICWSPTAIEQVEHHPGNVRLVARIATSNHHTAGSSGGVHMVTRATGLRPLWLNPERSVNARVRDLTTRPPTINYITAPLILLALVVLLGLSWTRSREIVAAAALSLVLCAALVETAAAVPSGNLGFAAATYTLSWSSFAGAFAYLTLAWGFAVLWLESRGRTFRTRRLGVLLAVGVAITCILASVRSATGSDRLPPGDKDYAAIRSAVGKTLRQLRPSAPVLVDAPISFAGGSSSIQSALAYAMRRNGISFALPPRLTIQSGAHYCPHAGHYSQLLVILDHEAKFSHRPSPAAALPHSFVYVVRGDTHLERQARDDRPAPDSGKPPNANSFEPPFRSGCGR